MINNVRNINVQWSFPLWEQHNILLRTDRIFSEGYLLGFKQCIRTKQERKRKEIKGERKKKQRNRNSRRI